MTWGVLQAAIQALLNLMHAQQWWGHAEATVFDGENEVATLILSEGVLGGGTQGASSSDASLSDVDDRVNSVQGESMPPSGT